MKESVRSTVALASAALAALFVEVMLIRWLATEIPVLGYFKNFPLMAAFVGLGGGVLLAGRARNHWFSGLIALNAVAAAVTFAEPLGLTALIFPDPHIDVWGRTLSAADPAATAILVRNLSLVAFVMAACVWSFVGLGQAIGEWFRAGPALRMYTADVAGSLAGVILFALLCRLNTGPHVWVGVAVVALGVAGWFRCGGSVRAVAPLSVLLVIAGVGWWRSGRGGEIVRWSPYYRLEVTTTLSPDLAGSRVLYRSIDVNRDIHQNMVDISEGAKNHYIAGTFRWRQWQWWRAQYTFPYRVKRAPAEVLIGGAGSGNNAAAALEGGAGRITAVDIDPGIIRIGREMHPLKPYDSPRVKLVNDDIRSFLRWSDDRFDLIEYGILDSHTALSALSSLRLENYVYTVEGIRDAVGHLKDDGVMCLSFYEGDRGWIGRRLFRNIAIATGEDPVPVKLGPTAFFVFGPGVDRSELEAVFDLAGFEDMRGVYGEDIRPSTDDWPFLYSHPDGQPLVYYLSLLLFVGLSAVFIHRATKAGRTAFGPGGIDWHMFLLGAGFLLIETKALAEMSLLFGSTWVVNAMVLSGVFVMVLLSVKVVELGWWRDLNAAYAALAAVLLGWYFFPRAVLNELGMGSRAIAGTVLVVLPLFFSGIIFARSFSAREDRPRAFGSNLLGAVVGGAAEAASLSLGIRFLTLLALLFYAGSRLAVRDSRRARPGSGAS